MAAICFDIVARASPNLERRRRRREKREEEGEEGEEKRRERERRREREGERGESEGIIPYSAYCLRSLALSKSE